MSTEHPAITFTVHDDVPPDAGALVDAGLGEANGQAAPLHEVRPLCCVARLATGEIIGGVVGRTWGLCCEVQQLWVHPDHRRRGVGRRLMGELHRRAEERGCRTFYLETFSFQAPAFYQSLGYAIRVEIRGFTKDIRRYVMVHE
jgi:ribosomal protein S18 acetylase RimI-like enzyme